jgi:hypothetical protein
VFTVTEEELQILVCAAVEKRRREGSKGLRLKDPGNKNARLLGSLGIRKKPLVGE